MPRLTVLCEPSRSMHCPRQRDLTARRLQHAGHKVKCRRFAGAIRADQPKDLPRLPSKRHAVDRDQPAKLLTRMIDRQ